MTQDQAKQELVKRYEYLYENANFILAPYMYEQSKQELIIKDYMTPVKKRRTPEKVIEDIA